MLDGSTKEWSLKEAQLMVASIELLTGTLELGSQEVGGALLCVNIPLPHNSPNLSLSSLRDTIFLLLYTLHSWTKYLSGRMHNAGTTTLVSPTPPTVLLITSPLPDDSPLTKALISLLLIAAERHKSCVKTVSLLVRL